MSQILIYFFIGISLSMDAFSIAISLGTLKPNNIIILKTGIIIGFFHLIMPILGSMIGKIIRTKIYLKANYIIAIIFFILALEMYFNKEETLKIKVLNIATILVIGFSVSLDSLSIGLALSLLKKEIILPSIIFSLTSSFFTIIGLIIGKKIKNKFNKSTNYLGVIILILLSLKYLFS